MSATDLPSWPLYQGVQGSEVKRWAHFNKVTFFSWYGFNHQFYHHLCYIHYCHSHCHGDNKGLEVLETRAW